MFNFPNNFLKVSLYSLLFSTLSAVLFMAPYPVVNAQTQVSLYPGQIGVFTLKYLNAGDGDAIASAITTVSLNDRLEYVPGFLSETFGGGVTNCAADSIGGGIVSVSSSTTSISYRPRSATTTTAPCNGFGTAGPATITAAPEATPGDQATWPSAKTGIITFRAKLRANLNLAPGETVNFALIADTALDNASGGTASLRIAVVVPPELVTADIPGLIVTCTAAKINSITTCNFNLPDGKSLPSGMTLSIGNSTTHSNPCVASGNAITCTGVSAGSQVGQQIINGKIGSDVKTDTRGGVNVLAVPVALPRTGGKGYMLLGLVAFSGAIAGSIYSISRKNKVKVN